MEIPKGCVLEELAEPVTALTDAHVKLRGELWMPSDIVLPPGVPREERIAELREAAQRTPPALRAIYAVHLLTEKALPSSFHLLAQTLDLDSVFKAWIGRWTAEEDRHGELLSKLAEVSGIIPNPGEFERWRFKYMEIGFRPHWHRDPYSMLAYAALQEESTRISHANLAVRLKQAGAYPFVAPIARVAAEENFHGRFYSAVVKLLFECDPERMLCSLWTSLEDFEMPAYGVAYYAEISYLAELCGTLTPGQIADSEEALLDFWGVESIAPQSTASDTAKSGLFARISMLREKQHRIDTRKHRARTFNFPFLSEPFKI